MLGMKDKGEGTSYSGRGGGKRRRGGESGRREGTQNLFWVLLKCKKGRRN